jgi:hypothetical protein
LWSFWYFSPFWHFFTNLVCCAEKNLATLAQDNNRGGKKMVSLVFFCLEPSLQFWRRFFYVLVGFHKLLMKDLTICHCSHQGCQIFLGPKYQNGETYTQIPQNIPNGLKIYQDFP